MHVRVVFLLMTSTGFATSSTRNISALKPCRIDSFGPFGARGPQLFAVPLNRLSTNSLQPAGFTRFRDTVRRRRHRHSTIGYIAGLQRFIEIPKIVFCLWKHHVVRVCSMVDYFLTSLIYVLAYGPEPTRIKRTAPSQTLCNRMQMWIFPNIMMNLMV
jgi:hypothetical protein